MATLKLSLDLAEAADLIGGLLLSAIRTQHDLLSITAHTSARGELPRDVQLGLARMATEHVLKCFSPDIRAKLEAMREELTAKVIGAEVVR